MAALPPVIFRQVSNLLLLALRWCLLPAAPARVHQLQAASISTSPPRCSVSSMTTRALGQVIRRLSAIDATSRYGVGRHPACLNFGDCFSYACAKA
jgi:hypothetical protein